jgi:glycosyltransferase involved in cell wall biosynthesis
MVVLEALAAGLPVVSLNLGGPGSIVNSSCGVVVEARETTEDEVIKKVAKSMIDIAGDARLRARMSAGAVTRARQTTWSAAVAALYSSMVEVEKVVQTMDVVR